MLQAFWSNLFRRLPAEHHDNFMLVTSVGTEIAIQNILGVEDEMIVLRGRISGSSDAGRVFFVPFAEINYAGFQKPLKEEEYQAIMGGANKAAPLPQPTVADATPLPATLTFLPGSSPGALTQTGGTVTPDGKPRPPAARSPLPLKSELLERLRSRSPQATAPRPKDG